MAGATSCRLLYLSLLMAATSQGFDGRVFAPVQIVWNCFLSTLSHAPSFDIHQLSGVVDEADGLLSQWGHATAVSPPEPLSAVIAQAQELLSQYLPQPPAIELPIELPNIKLEVPTVIELQPTHSQPF